MAPKELPLYGTAGDWGYSLQLVHSEILLSDNLLKCDPEFIAATIVHETVHSRQLDIWKAWWGEKKAYEKQSEFLKAIGVSGTVQQLGKKFPDTQKIYFLDHADAFKDYGIENPAITR